MRAATNNVTQQSLQSLLPIVQPAAQIGEDLDIRDAGVGAVPFESRGLRFERCSLVVRANAHIPDRLSRSNLLRAEGCLYRLTLVPSMSTDRPAERQYQPLPMPAPQCANCDAQLCRSLANR